MRYRYRFNPDVDMEDVEAAMVLAAWGVESLHGEIQARLASGHVLDPVGNVCVIDVSTAAGEDFNTLFYGFVRREVDDACFVIERLDSHPRKITA